MNVNFLIVGYSVHLPVAAELPVVGVHLLVVASLQLTVAYISMTV